MSNLNDLAINAEMYDFDPSYGYTLAHLLQVEAPIPPPDFAKFWQQRYQNALNINPQPETTDLHQVQSGWRVFNISYKSTDQFPIRGWLLIPESGIIRRGFIIGHGYGGRDAPDFHLPFTDAALLFPCFRGLSLSQRAPISSEPNWHVLHEIDTLDRYILGGCVEDLWLATSTILQLFPQTLGRLGYLGISFGGGIGALALPWEPRISRGHFNVPSFGHHPLRLQLHTHGSAHSVQKYYRYHQQETLKVLSYYDAAIAGQYMQQPIHCACAPFDPCVAPPGQFAIYNALPGIKQLYILDAGHHPYQRQSQQEQELIHEIESFFSLLIDPPVQTD